MWMVCCQRTSSRGFSSATQALMPLPILTCARVFGRLPYWSSGFFDVSQNKVLYKLRDHKPATAIQVNTVRMELPAVQSRDIIRTLTEHHGAKRVPVKRQKPEFCKRMRQSILHRGGKCFMHVEILDALLCGNFANEPVQCRGLPIDFLLQWVRCIQVFADGRK